MFCCNKPPAIAPATPQTVWIDAETRGDTIITNVNNNWPVLYYAIKDWRLSVDTDLSRGYRFIGVRFGDSILVKPLGDSSTNYDGPFLLETNKENDTLKAQNFLETTTNNPVKKYILLH